MKKLLVFIASVFVGFVALAAPNKVSSGDVLSWKNTTGSAVTSGSLVKIGDVYGVALTDIADTATGAVAIQGVWRFTVAAGTVTAQGVKLYFNSASSVKTNVVANTAVGCSVSIPAATATSVDVLLNATQQ